VHSLGLAALALWYLGYPEQSRTRIDEGLHLAQEFAHPFSHAQSLFIAAELYGERGDGRLAQEYADAEVAVSREHGFPVYLAYGTVHQGKMLMTRGQWAEGVSQVKQGLEMLVGELQKTRFLAWLARGYGGAGQVEDGLTTVAEALRLVEKNDDRHYEAEVWRIKGELTLQKEARGWRLETSPPSPQASSLKPLVSSGTAQEAEGYFLKAIEIAQKQQAKSLELRAVMSLVRLRQQQAAQSEARITDRASRAKLDEAHRMLSEVYDWFTEGFDTRDLQEAKVLLQDLGAMAKRGNGEMDNG
jgi:tetratricopeptide (TPR) repeat protein